MIDKTLYRIRYHSQKCAAGKRGIEWHFTFDSWLEWWGDDIVNRGRKAGQLVMARYGDIGHYHPDNVFKTTMNDNISQANIGRVHTIEHSINKGNARKAAWDRFRELEMQ
jgi:hypothetical protein